MHRYRVYQVVVFLFGLLLVSCNHAEKQQLTIAVTKASPENKFASYKAWLERSEPAINVIDLSVHPIDSVYFYLSEADGLLIPGGTDIYPQWYGDEYDSSVFQKPDLHRDSLEWQALSYAVRNHLPVLGICRGNQMINVYLGGTLVHDIPTETGSKVVHSDGKGYGAGHEVFLKKNNRLTSATGINEGEVNSAHHQCVGEVAPGLEVIARAPDSLPEAVSWANAENQAFLLGVQWHPERLEDDNPLSKHIRELFLQAVSRHNNSRHD
ncbi:MAG: hypothetical protein Kow00127_06810 [Bacteroidales bacterium]